MALGIYTWETASTRYWWMRVSQLSLKMRESEHVSMGRRLSSTVRCTKRTSRMAALGKSRDFVEIVMPPHLPLTRLRTVDATNVGYLRDDGQYAPCALQTNHT
jgi:hypothetical protein